MSIAAYRRRMVKKLQAVVAEMEVKRFNKNPKARKNGDWLKSKPKSKK